MGNIYIYICMELWATLIYFRYKPYILARISKLPWKMQ